MYTQQEWTLHQKTLVDEQAKVTDLETTGRIEGIPEETTQVSEITFDVSQAEQKYPEMTLVLEQKGDMKSENSCRGNYPETTGGFASERDYSGRIHG